MKSSQPIRALTMVSVIMLGATACTPFTKIQGDDKAEAKMNGSWSVMYVGKNKLEGVEPLPTIVFDTANNSISGFDGCNNFKGTYTFDNGYLKASVAGTRMACRSDAARNASGQVANLFENGAEVVEVSIARGYGLVMRNGSAELSLGPTDVLTKNLEK